MNKITMNIALALISVAALGGGACSSGTAAKTDGGGGNAGTSGGIVLVPSDTGFLDGSNPAMVLGAWYSYGDNYSMTGQAGMGDCENVGMHPSSACSMITTPAPGQPFAPNPSGAMCTSGTAAQVINLPGTMTADYSGIFGAGIGLDFNNGGLDGGMGKQPYNATMHGITGVKFDIDMAQGNNLRVEFPTAAVVGTTDKNSAYWKGAAGNSSPVKAGTTSFKWADVNGPMYETNPPAFDPTKVLSIQFHIVTNTSAAVPFSFCISNLTLLTN